MAGAAAQLGAIVRGLDFSEQVLAIARRLYPAIRFDQGDAQALPYPTDSFDTVLCGYGLIHLPEPKRALAEMHRVVKPGGRIAVSVWARPAPGNGFALLFGAIRTHGRLEKPLPHGPAPKASWIYVRGVQKNYAEAVKWYRQTSEKGDQHARQGMHEPMSQDQVQLINEIGTESPV